MFATSILAAAGVAWLAGAEFSGTGRVAVPVQATDSRPPAAAPRNPLVPRPEKNPFANLFSARPPNDRAEPVELPRTNRPRVVCGMTVLSSDAEIDAKFKWTPKPDADVEHKIRAIVPPVCVS